jgi:hypothetical protein
MSMGKMVRSCLMMRSFASHRARGRWWYTSLSSQSRSILSRRTIWGFSATTTSSQHPSCLHMLRHPIRSVGRDIYYDLGLCQDRVSLALTSRINTKNDGLEFPLRRFFQKLDTEDSLLPKSNSLSLLHELPCPLFITRHERKLVSVKNRNHMSPMDKKCTYVPCSTRFDIGRS